MTLAEYIAELERRAMSHRQNAIMAQRKLPSGASGAVMIATITESMRSLGLEEAALLAREIEL